MKKITIFVNDLFYNGISRSVCSLANALVNKYELEIVATYKLSDKPAFNIDDKINIKYLIEDERPNQVAINKALKSFKFFKLIKLLQQKNKLIKRRDNLLMVFIKACDSDVIITTEEYLNTLVGRYAPKKTFKIGWCHRHHQRKVKKVNSLVASTLGLDKVAFVSKYLTNWYIREYKVRRIPIEALYIPNFIDYLPTNLSKLNNNNLIAVGSLTKGKGFTDLIKVFKIMVDFNPNIHLDIVGDGEEKGKLESLIKELKLTKAITLNGNLNEQDLSKLYEKSSIYLMASYVEAFGLPLIEAMSHGLPCISFTSADGSNELITEGFNGHLIADRNGSEMARLALELLNDKEKLKKFSNNAIETAKCYAKDKIITEWIKLITTK